VYVTPDSSPLLECQAAHPYEHLSPSLVHQRSLDSPGLLHFVGPLSVCSSVGSPCQHYCRNVVLFPLSRRCSCFVICLLFH
jgi:hypothetical protein